MSILPSTTNQASPSSSSTSPFQNPNLNHGNNLPGTNQPPSPPQHHRHHHQHHQRFPLSSPDIYSLRISDHESSAQSPNSIPGTVAGGAANSSGSSTKMTGYGNPNGKRISSNQSINGRVQTHFAAQGVGSSEISREVSSPPPNGRASGSSRRRSQIVNGNHLLNFQYNPISRPQPRAPPLRKPQRIKPYNKDLFLQANYRFVVLDSGNYTLESMDPDKFLQWEDIICVRYSTPHPVQCPICLDDPLCPQITSCGHVFCFPCILQYLLMGEDNHKAECRRKCPLCFLMISTKDLYTIYIENVRELHIGDTLEFMLLTRKKDTFLLHEKVKGGVSTKTHDLFSKFILTLDVDLSVREAISALDNWLVRADSGLVDDLEKLPYVCTAMEQLQERKKYWIAHRNSAGSTSCKLGDCKILNDELSSCKADNPQHGSPSSFDDTIVEVDNIITEANHGGGLVQSSDTDESQEGQEALSSSFDEGKSLQIQAAASRDPKERDSYNFYQAFDGQPIFLHPLNMRCLLHHYGSYDLLPLRLSGKVLQLESVTQSDTMRRRYRYLSHIPLTRTFQLCEIDLTEIVPLDALSPFMDEIKKREKRRKQLARKERGDRSKAEAVDTYSLPIPYTGAPSSFDASPTFSMDDFEALGSSSTVVASSPVNGGRQLFANVARMGFAAGCDSPSLNRQETTPQPAVESTSAIGSLGASTQVVRSFANVISQEVSRETPEARTTNEGGKKGKKQSRVLLSTSGGRRY